MIRFTKTSALHTINYSNLTLYTVKVYDVYISLLNYNLILMRVFPQTIDFIPNTVNVLYMYTSKIIGMQL